MSGTPDSGRVAVKQSTCPSISICIGMRFATHKEFRARTGQAGTAKPEGACLSASRTSHKK
ncbi:hypothetical protein JG687_00017260 [Phytophthora cactorum]|uniref:Uncharacterized protein n=1 Tax=Phytophthora cactorum TaxID=29920 RepID=A0A8T1TNJ3_9STRA|nr:hypothetical protein JG687_00017260 [Phytophthora cactorum]